MKLLFSLIPLLVLAPLPFVSLSQSNSLQSPVEISGEPRHHPKFENEFVRLWDVTVPAGDATLWHAHRNDNVVVSFGDVRLRIETLGRDPLEGPWKFGEVRFSKATYIHRALNVGTTSFHNFTIELLKTPGGATLKKEPGREPVLENERVRVFRVALDPGESGPMHTHTVPILAIALTAAELEVTTAGRAQPERVKRPEGNVLWRSEAVTHAIKNVGTTRYEGVDIEFK
jgi:quercetin dioxygenase-like cupin family protein